jgi:hypothetical protein
VKRGKRGRDSEAVARFNDHGKKEENEQENLRGEEDGSQKLSQELMTRVK